MANQESLENSEAKKAGTGEVENKEAIDGAMIVFGKAVFFIPRDDLRSFRVPDAMAAMVHAKLEERRELVRSNPNDPVVLGVELDISGPVLEFSAFVEHCLTVSRIC